MARFRSHNGLLSIALFVSLLLLSGGFLALVVTAGAAPSPSAPEVNGVTTQLAVLLDGSRSIDEWELSIDGLRMAINDDNFPKDGSVELTVIQFGDHKSRREVGPVVITTGNYSDIRDRIDEIEILAAFGTGTPMACAFYRLTDLWAGNTVSDTNWPGNESGAWTDPTFAFYNGSGAASATTGLGQQYRAYSFGLPGSLVLEGIEVRLDAWRTSGAGRTGAISVELSWDGGSSWTSTGYVASPLVGSQSVFYLGGPTNTWGRTWTADEINRLRVRVRSFATGSGTMVYLDWIPVTLHYHLTGWDKTLRQVVNIASDGNAQCECDDPTGTFNCGDLAAGRASAVAARDAMLSVLGFDNAQDRIDAEGLDDGNAGMNWMRDNIVWPQPGQRVPKLGNQMLFPFDVGWVLDIDSRSQFERAILFKLLGEELQVGIGAEPTSGCWPLEVELTGSAKGGVGDYTLRWQFKDGTHRTEQPESLPRTTTHTYDPGIYTPTLYVFDEVGGWGMATVDNPIECEVCLDLEKSDQRDPVCNTWRIRYTITLVNSGEVTLNGMLVTDTLPIGTYFVSADAGGIGSYGNPLVTWDVDLPPDYSRELHLEVGTLSTLVGEVTNSAQALFVHRASENSVEAEVDEWLETQREDAFTWTVSAEETTLVNNCPRPTPPPDTGPGTCPRPGFSDYAPHGLPDFSQKQNGWTGSGWTHAGPVAAADVLWYLDAQAESSLGTKHGLVADYLGGGDHAPANVPPLVEDLAGRMGVVSGGVDVEAVVDGLAKYMAAKGVAAAFDVEVLKNPTKSLLLERAVKDNAVPMLLLGFWQQQGGSWVRVGGHWVAACCILADGAGIQFSDPWFDRAAGGYPGRVFGLPPSDPTVYNDAANVSFDEYVLGATSVPGATWSPAGYGGASLGDLVGNSLMMNSAADLAGLAGAFSPDAPVSVAVDYAILVRPIPGYPGYVTHQAVLREGSKQTYLYRYAPTSNYGAEPLLKVGYKQTNASLIAFDLSAIPAGAVIEDAQVELYATGWGGADVNVSAYAVRAPWAENEATWNAALSAAPWAAGGCNDTSLDRYPEAFASLTTQGPNRWYSLQAKDLVQGWLDGTLPNHGILLRGDPSTNSVVFAGGEYVDAALRPRLTVYYH